MEPGAEERVDDESALAGEVVGLDDVPSRLAKDPRGDPPVAAVRAPSAHGGDAARVRVRAEHLGGDRRAGALHQLARRAGYRVPLLRARISAAV